MPGVWEMGLWPIFRAYLYSGPEISLMESILLATQLRAQSWGNSCSYLCYKLQSLQLFNVHLVLEGHVCSSTQSH